MGRYSIWLVQTGEMVNFPRSQLYYGQHNSGTLATPLGFVVVSGEDHIAVIDTGFQTDPVGLAMAAREGVTSGHSAKQLLPMIGIDPLAVDTAIITHAHWDHMGGLADFPNATIYLQERELESWTRARSLPAKFSYLAGGISVRDFAELERRQKEGEVHLVRGHVADALPDIDLMPAFDTHTWGHQYVLIKTEQGPYVAVGDLIFTFAHLEGLDRPGVYVPPGQALGSQEKVLRTYDEIMQLVGGDAGRIIPCHDFAAYSRFSSTETVDGLRVAEVVLASSGESPR